jgi:trans-aconitate methyltransferase
MIRQANERLGTLPNATFHETSGADLAPFFDAMFDLVFSFIVFQHIPDRAVVFNYIREPGQPRAAIGVPREDAQQCAGEKQHERPPEQEAHRVETGKVVAKRNDSQTHQEKQHG